MIDFPATDETATLSLFNQTCWWNCEQPTLRPSAFAYKDADKPIFLNSALGFCKWLHNLPLFPSRARSLMVYTAFLSFVLKHCWMVSQNAGTSDQTERLLHPARLYVAVAIVDARLAVRAKSVILQTCSFKAVLSDGSVTHSLCTALLCLYFQWILYNGSEKVLEPTGSKLGSGVAVTSTTEPRRSNAISMTDTDGFHPANRLVTVNRGSFPRQVPEVLICIVLFQTCLAGVIDTGFYSDSDSVIGLRYMTHHYHYQAFGLCTTFVWWRGCWYNNLYGLVFWIFTELLSSQDRIELCTMSSISRPFIIEPKPILHKEWLLLL